MTHVPVGEVTGEDAAHRNADQKHHLGHIRHATVLTHQVPLELQTNKQIHSQLVRL